MVHLEFVETTDDDFVSIFENVVDSFYAELEISGRH